MRRYQHPIFASFFAICLSMLFSQTNAAQNATLTVPPSATSPAYSLEQIENGRGLFTAQCGFCHGRDAMGGETGPDLTHSAVVADDLQGDKIGAVVRAGRAEKGMPSFNLSQGDVSAIVGFIHAQKANVDALVGKRRTVEVSDLQTGDAAAGKQYFQGIGGCAKCHSPTGNLAGINRRLQGLMLLRRMLNPADRGTGISGQTIVQEMPAKVSVTMPLGQMISGTLAYQDEFTIALTDATGKYHSWSTNKVKFTIENPLDAHIEQLGKYTDNDIHNLIAYLQTFP